MLRAIALVLIGLLPVTPATARYCSQPTAPSAIYSKPSKPYCAITRDCEDWQIRSYRTELESYFGKLKRYLAEADTYYEEAYAYAKCMADLD
jgi:hypothetical protein